MNTHHLNRTLIRYLVLGGALVVLAGCGTTAINQMAMEAHRESLLTQRTAIEQHQNACASNAVGCRDDMCRVAVTLACALGQPEMRIEAPRLRSPGEEFARGFSPIASLAQAGIQVWGAGWLVDRSGQNMVDLVTASGGLVQQVGGVIGPLQGPVDNSITVGGNYGDSDSSTNVGGNLGNTETVGRDQIGGDQRLGDDIDGSCIGDACRNTSPGPIDQSDNSDNSDNSTNPPPDPEPDPDP